MKVTELRSLVSARSWLTFNQLLYLLKDAYGCDYRQAKALLQIAILNKIVEQNIPESLYRIKDEKTH